MGLVSFVNFQAVLGDGVLQVLSVLVVTVDHRVDFIRVEYSAGLLQNPSEDAKNFSFGPVFLLRVRHRQSQAPNTFLHRSHVFTFSWVRSHSGSGDLRATT